MTGFFLPFVNGICIYRVLQNNCIKLCRGIDEPKIKGVARAKKIDFCFATELWAFDIEKSKHIFINITKTTDLNSTKFCTQTFPATFFSMIINFFSIMVRFVKNAICKQIMTKNDSANIFFLIIFFRFIIMFIKKKRTPVSYPKKWKVDEIFDNLFNSFGADQAHVLKHSNK